MKKLFYLFSLLIFGGLILTSCGNDDDEVTPQTGSIKATVSPAGAATNMRVTQGSTTVEITPNSSGIFQADNLQAGDYAVTFTPATGFQAPSARNVTVTGGNTSDLGNVVLTQPGNQFLGSMAASVNGSPWNSVIHAATIDGNSLTISGTIANLTGTAEVIALTIPNFNGSGSYSGPNDASGVYMTTSLGTGSQNMWTTDGPGGNCAITITNFDQVNQKVSGTFSFTAIAAPGTSASGTRTINNGTFTNLNIQ